MQLFLKQNRRKHVKPCISQFKNQENLHSGKINSKKKTIKTEIKSDELNNPKNGVAGY